MKKFKDLIERATLWYESSPKGRGMLLMAFFFSLLLPLTFLVKWIGGAKGVHFTFSIVLLGLGGLALFKSVKAINNIIKGKGDRDDLIEKSFFVIMSFVFIALSIFLFVLGIKH